MPLSTINGHVFFFVHVPKCGGSSVEAFLARHGRLSLVGSDWRMGRCSPQHMHRRIYDKVVPPEGYDHGFVIFRDPLERMKSEFRMKAREPRPSRNPFNLLMRLRARFTGQRLYEFTLRGVRLHLDFALWSRIVLFAARRNPFVSDNHFRPQSEFWKPEHEVFFLEDGMEPVFRWIAKTAGLRIRPAAIRENRGADVEIVCPPETERRIRAFYAADYALFERLRAARAGERGDARERSRERAVDLLAG